MSNHNYNQYLIETHRDYQEVYHLHREVDVEIQDLSRYHPSAVEAIRSLKSRRLFYVDRMRDIERTYRVPCEPVRPKLAHV